MMRKFWIALLSLGLLLSFSLALALAQPPFTIERVSVASDGTQGNGSSGAWELPSIALSADGRFVAFVSHASNLVPGDTNGMADVFIRDRLTGETTRISIASDGSQGNDSVESYGLALSPDGRFVAFVSRASNLVSGDTNGMADVFVQDRLTGETTRVSVASDGTQADQRSRNPVLSADGRFVAFQSLAQNLVPASSVPDVYSVFLHDRQSGETTHIAVGRNASLSADGRFIAFEQGTVFEEAAIFVHDRQTSTTTLVSIASDGTPGNNRSANPALSADGRFVTFVSWASNLVSGDTNSLTDIFVHDRQTSTTSRIPADNQPFWWMFPHIPDSPWAGPSISADGRFVTFMSWSSSLTLYDNNNALDVFVHDRQAGQTLRVSVQASGIEANGASFVPRIAADGSSIAFVSWASNLVPGDSNERRDVFLASNPFLSSIPPTIPPTATPAPPPISSRPLTMELVSVAPDGTMGNGSAYWASLSADGRFVAFTSDATNLVPNDTNDVMDVFVRDRLTDETTRVSVASDGSEANASIVGSVPSISDDGRFVTFSSNATNLVTGLTGIFLHDRETGVTSHIARTTYEPYSDVIDSVISGDGRFIAFTSSVSDLVPGDTNGRPDVFVYDRQTSEISRVSVASDGSEADSDSWLPSISADGRFVGFVTAASNLTPDSLPGIISGYVHDRLTGETTLISVDSDGVRTLGFSWLWDISADGRYVAFDIEVPDLVPNPSIFDLLIHDRQTGETRCVSCSLSELGYTNRASFSADARYLVFDYINTEFSLTLVSDVYIYDLLTEEIRLVSVSSAGTSEKLSIAPSISADGTFIAFNSGDASLVSGISSASPQILIASNPFVASGPVFTPTPTPSPSPTATATPTPTATATPITSRPLIMDLVSVDAHGVPGNGSSMWASLSADGRFVAFTSAAINLVPNDTNGVMDVFVRDRLTGETTRVSVASEGTEGNDSSGAGYMPSISADGRFVTFGSQATNLVPGFTGIFVRIFLHDRQTNETTHIAEGGAPVISADGRFIAFFSDADNLVPGDTNGRWDVFVYDRLDESITRVSVASDGSQAIGGSLYPRISADGRFVAFNSDDSSLAPGFPFSGDRGFIHDRLTGETTLLTVDLECSQVSGYSCQILDISPDARYVAYKTLINGPQVIAGETYIRDRQMNQTRCVSCLMNDLSINWASFSGDNRYLAFDAYDSENSPSSSINVYVYDLMTEEIRLVSLSVSGITEGFSLHPGISADGNFVAFMSSDTGLASGITQEFSQILVASNPFIASAPVLTPTPTPAASATPSPTPTPSSTPTPALADVPALIEPADAALLSANRPLFRWAASLGAVRYQLRLDTISPPAAIVYEGTGTRYTPPTPLIVSTYFWQVRALDGSGGSSDWSPIRSLTIQSPANAAPSLNYFTTSTPTLSWGRVSQAIAYEIQVDNERSFAAPLFFWQIVDGSTFEATITPALPDGTYFWRVRAQSANGQWRPWSVIDSFIVDVP